MYIFYAHNSISISGQVIINKESLKKSLKKEAFKRAENGIRTRDPQLGKLMLYQLSYFRTGCKNT